ncbi:TolC family protein [Pontibacter sp. JH31]|uniref:TolC family protein n=1 Tax=Pontibacter aquaedesilientis TaxID=2766980 RepID=A0ABR7XEZ1_9BACT|nr:TolC family protein [Pontibacter aquaedesilientis]MBD1396860.1 TolC family protein [Pontibacter aquaedesilientis]
MSPFKAMALLFLGAVLLLPGRLSAQERLTLEQAIKIGLENNYDIRIASTEQEIAKNNLGYRNLALLPTIDGRVAKDFSRNDIRNQFENNEPRVVDNSTNNITNASVLLNWTLFDGGRMFINYNRLKSLDRSGQLLTKATIENSLADILDAYFEVVRQSRKISSIEDAIAISQQRVDITQEQYEVGVSAKVEILRARVDFNADRSELLRQQELLQNAKISLNQLLGRDPNIDFVTTDTIMVNTGLEPGNVGSNMMAGNPNLQRIQVNRDLALYNLRSARSLRLPSIGLTGSYGYNRALQDPVIFGNTVGTNESQRIGFNYGVALTLPIFNGMDINRQIQNSRIALESTTLAYSQEQNRLQSELARTYARYVNRIQLLELEESNVLLAKQNADIAMERYRLGLLTAIELREAQRNQLVAENRLIDIQYEAKAAETELKRLSSTLLQENAE